MNDVARYDPGEQLRRDWDVVRLLKHLLSPQEIAKQLGRSLLEVNGSLARISDGITEDMKTEMAWFVLDDLRELRDSWWDKAVKDHDIEAAHYQLRIADLKCKMGRLYFSPKGDRDFEQRTKDRESSMAGIERGLDLLCGNTPVIEGEVVKDESL